MRRNLTLGALAAAILVLAVFAPGGVLSLLDTDTCDWQVVEIEGETYDSLDELRDEADRRGADFDELFGDIEFRERGGVLEYRPDVCGVEEVPADQ